MEIKAIKTDESLSMKRLGECEIRMIAYRLQDPNHTVYSLQTYNADAQIGESSACATALMCGVKANFETVGLDINGQFENCKSSLQNAQVPSLIDWAQKEGEFVINL